MKTDPGFNKQVVVIGGGPAGLTTAYELIKYGLRPIVLEKGHIVGGLARTENYKGFYFDIGGHRFFTKLDEVMKFWRQMLGDEFLLRPRLSRIYYQKKFFHYPLKPLNALLGLGCFQSIGIVLSYLRWQLFPYDTEDTFEQWVTNRFGKRLFQTFFKTYTEKVWGIPCSELKAEWAAQRIKDLSLRTAMLSMFVKPQRSVKTLSDELYYPRLGPGMLWNRVKERVENQGGVVCMKTEVIGIRRAGNRIDSVMVARNGDKDIIRGTDFISSMPVTEVIGKLDPPPPPAVLQAARRLSYRDFLTVCLIVNKPDLFPDNWIYVHDPDVNVGRIQNFKNWSPDMVPDPMKTSLGLEYFCTEGDQLWTMPDADLIELGKRELEQIGLARCQDVEDGCVFRVPKSYPVYDSDYRQCLAEIRQFVESLDNFQTIGRNGLHRYNNQDHAMLTGVLAVRNLMLGQQNDLWSINTDQAYHEEIRTEVRKKAQQAPVLSPTAVIQNFFKLDRVALGLSLGVMCGVLLFLITLCSALVGGDPTGLNLQQLSAFLPGYSPTVLGSIIGLEYGFAYGFLLGGSIALVRNAIVILYLIITQPAIKLHYIRHLLRFL
jgi:protoporphyrinogen oxidase